MGRWTLLSKRLQGHPEYDGANLLTFASKHWILDPGVHDLVCIDSSLDSLGMPGSVERCLRYKLLTSSALPEPSMRNYVESGEPKELRTTWCWKCNVQRFDVDKIWMNWLQPAHRVSEILLGFWVVGSCRVQRHLFLVREVDRSFYSPLC